MISCPICLHVVPDSFQVCPFCSADLGSEPREELADENWTIVRTVSTSFEAELIAGRLRSFEIPAVVLSQVDTTRNFTVGALAVAKVFVPESRLAESEEILASEPTDSQEEGPDQDVV